MLDSITLIHLPDVQSIIDHVGIIWKPSGCAGPLLSKQVMKMVVSLTVEESGIIRYVRRPGTLLEAGCVVARLELDDPTKVHLVSNGAAGSCLGEERAKPAWEPLGICRASRMDQGSRLMHLFRASLSPQKRLGCREGG